MPIPYPRYVSLLALKQSIVTCQSHKGGSTSPNVALSLPVCPTYFSNSVIAFSMLIMHAADFASLPNALSICHCSFFFFFFLSFY